MVARAPDPRRLDVAALARDGGRLEGRWPLASFDRLCQDHPSDAPATEGNVRWAARGELRKVPGGEAQVWLHLDCAATVHRSCQRCLHAVALPLHVQRALRFVADETQAEQLDLDSDEDVLTLERALDLHALVEDELLLALPMVPRHEHCEPPAAGVDETLPSDDETREHPFAALAQWRGKPPH